MRKVMTSISNSLMAVSITRMLNSTGDYDVRLVKPMDGMTAECRAAPADIVLMEVAYSPGFTIDERLREISQLRKTASGCKVLVLCDENSAPELARKVAHAKRDGLIDGFVYSSVSQKYFVAMLDAM